MGLGFTAAAPIVISESLRNTVWMPGDPVGTSSLYLEEGAFPILASCPEFREQVARVRGRMFDLHTIQTLHPQAVTACPAPGT